VGDRPSGRQVALTIALAAITVTATGLLVSNIQIADIGTEGGSIQTFTNKIAEVMMPSLYILWAAVFAYILIGLVSSQRKKGQVKTHVAPSSWHGPVIGLLILTVWIALMKWTGLKFSIFGDDEGAQDGNNVGDGSMTTPADGDLSSGSFVYIFLAILLASLVAVYLVYLRKPTGDPYRNQLEMRGSQSEIEFVDKAMEELYQGNDLRSIIIRLYQQMCRLVKDKERSDERFLTPREFAALATGKLGWPDVSVNELTSLFEEARYSSHDIDESMKERAIRCLEDIRTAIDRRSGEPGKGGIPTAGG